MIPKNGPLDPLNTDFDTDLRTAKLPENTRTVLKNFTEEAKKAFGENLIGVYLHGSAVLGGFNEKKSDLDLIVVVKEEPRDGEKRAFMDALLKLSQKTSEKGIEMSVLSEASCRPFVFPTPFFLHFSETHRAWYERDPEDYIAHMKGTDPDLAAHFMILYHRGIRLYGASIRSVFDCPDSKSYLAGIEADIEESPEEIADNPVYYILNLLRVLAYKRQNLVLSKKDAALRALQEDEFKAYGGLILSALQAYTEGTGEEFSEKAGKTDKEALDDEGLLRTFSSELLQKIKSCSMNSRRSWFLTEEAVQVCFEKQALRVRNTKELSEVFRKGRKAGRKFARRLLLEYRIHEETELHIGAGSLYAELKLHAFFDRVFTAFSRFFGRLHLSPLQKLCDRLHVHAYQIDCGEKTIDRNRLVFDLLAPLYGGK